MRQSGHKRRDTLRKYIRHATVFLRNAAAKVGPFWTIVVLSLVKYQLSVYEN
jgi:hypothetical protein